MTPLALPADVTVDVRLRPDDLAAALRRDVVAGLGRRPLTLAPTWFYDDHGCGLYEQITRLPEYYPFRTERDLLRRASGQVAEAAGASVLVELGSGTSEKTHELLAAMAGATAGLDGYVGFDVSEATLRAAARTVADEWGVGVHAIVGDFRQHLAAVAGAVPPGCGPSAPRLVAFLGSTIGNLVPAERAEFLAGLAATLRPADRLLLATDLVKPADRLVAAYDDSSGVTAAFNRNVLRVLNRELGAGFDPSHFAHVAVWDPANRWIEMRLRAETAMSVPIPGVGLVVELAEGDEIRTEISAKFTPSRVSAELAAAGLETMGLWSDPAGDYLLTLARPARGPTAGP